MKFEDSEHFNTLKYYKLEKPFGKFYFLETFFIAELNEGVHFDWKMIQEVMNEIVKFYNKGVQLGYISNRVNSYSINPQTWDLVEKEYGIIVAAAIVSYNNLTFMNATLEKNFTKKSIKRCTSLSEAIHWVTNIKEFKN